ncbi:MAG TPA: DNA repair protein RecO [Kiritimatiellia bacterium]|nr:DNA repair protein RecO [Kiritimatiellia bacterium]
MSRLVKTSGIVLRHAPHSESSRYIHWLTRDHGRLVTIAKGVQRPRNRMLGQFDLLYTCELIYYARDRDAVYITSEIAAMETRPELRSDWRAATASIYCADLAGLLAPPHEPVTELFDLLDSALDEFACRGWHAPSLFLFELRILELMGVAPRLHECASCRKPLPPGSTARFSSRQGGMLCSACEDRNATYSVGADVLAILKNWELAKGWSATRTARCSIRQLSAIRTLLGDFLLYHLDLKPGRRNNTLDMLMPLMDTAGAVESA